MLVFRVEYLITVDQKDAFCKTVTSFNNLARHIESINIHTATVKARIAQIQATGVVPVVELDAIGDDDDISSNGTNGHTVAD